MKVAEYPELGFEVVKELVKANAAAWVCEGWRVMGEDDVNRGGGALQQRCQVSRGCEVPLGMKDVAGGEHAADAQDAKVANASAC